MGGYPKGQENLKLTLEYEITRSFVRRARTKWFSEVGEKFFNGSVDVLEVGSGLGLLKHNLPGHRGAWYHLDADELVLAFAKREFPDRAYIIGSALELPFPDGSLDVVCGFNCYDFMLAFGEKPFREAKRVLKKGGYFIHFQDLQTNFGVGDSTFQMEPFEMVWSQIYPQMTSVLKKMFRSAGVGGGTDCYTFSGPRTPEQREKGAFVFNYNHGMHWANNYAAIGESRRKLPAKVTDFLVTDREIAAYENALKVAPALAPRLEPHSHEIYMVSHIVAKR